MKKQISLSEVDALVRKSIMDKGLNSSITEQQIEEIKKKIKAKLSMPSNGAFFVNPTVVPDSIIDSGGDFDGDMGGAGDISEIAGIDEEQSDEDVIEVPSTDEPVSHETIVDDKSMEMANKEGQLQAKEQELNQKQSELQNKEEELTYKPVLPNSLIQAEPGKLFIYDMTQLSLGGESLSNQPYNIKDNPEMKTSMHDLWINDGKIRAEIFQVEFKPIGEIVFDPFNGTSKFVEMQQPLESDLPQEEREGVQQAINSQIPIEPMIDSTTPIVDITLPMSNDMGLKAHDVHQALEQAVEKILRNHFISNA